MVSRQPRWALGSNQYVKRPRLTSSPPSRTGIPVFSASSAKKERAVHASPNAQPRPWSQLSYSFST